ncbi:sugar phosphate isomerase/epimerase family protein [Telmatospirillum sp.]|uniref:sugar phosphate isomerase/epimerase family protein n=1 Tax=Telmatospirillum sp. TaxID=2079197 RepID=UPI00283D29B5|nr:sugar phosphate isomerase/epimerase family protein [Telmatospirillum sp.]MDR3436830.1 sugar phosphate isomerase/epimerase [Telmatospirillum sp.]
MISPEKDPSGIEIVETLAELQFDYIELSLSHLTSMDEAAFSKLARRIERSGIACEACNNFVPARIRLTGPDADLGSALEYAKAALDRAGRLGARTIVFGSSGAKNVPAGFPHDQAWRQIVQFLQALGPLAAPYGITIAIEPLNRQESNIVTLAAEGLRLSRDVGHPNIQLLIDFYHLRRENEDFGILLEAKSAIRHVHFAEVRSRIFPIDDDDDYQTFFDYLQKIGYDGRCSIEAYTKNFGSEAPRALAMLKAIASRSKK